jgi:hypothetical protein
VTRTIPVWGAGLLQEICESARVAIERDEISVNFQFEICDDMPPCGAGRAIVSVELEFSSLSYCCWYGAAVRLQLHVRSGRGRKSWLESMPGSQAREC